MLDINYIRKNQTAVKKAIKDKNIKLNLDHLLEVDKKRRTLIQEIDKLKAQQNKLSKTKPDDKTIKELQELKIKIKKLNDDFNSLKQEYDELMAQVPTVPAADTPIAQDDSGNVEIHKSGQIPEFDFETRDHIKLGQDLDILDLEKGAKVSGYRGYYVKNQGVSLMMSFLMHALNTLIAQGYQPMIPPTLVNSSVLFASGYVKGLEYDSAVDEIYQIAHRDKGKGVEETQNKKFLVGTAEPSLLAYFSDDVLKEEDLPIKIAGYSQCYRSEIGSYGKDVKGIYRVHEFMKIEQVILCKADMDEAEKLHQELINNSQKLHQDLGLPYRLLRICSGDLSAGKYKAVDTEAWMPGRNAYGETGSASNFLDWQARRLNVRYIDKDGRKKYVYMLNGTALPSPRIFISILENYQQKDGSVIVPEILRKYMPGELERIARLKAH